jgi:hypothetical protein
VVVVVIGRARVPASDPHAAEQLATLIARHDQALALVDELVRQASPGGVHRLVDGLLDLRLILRPPPTPAKPRERAP